MLAEYDGVSGWKVFECFCHFEFLHLLTVLQSANNQQTFGVP